MSIIIIDYKEIDTIYIFKFIILLILAGLKFSRDLLQISGKAAAVLDGQLNQRQLLPSLLHTVVSIQSLSPV